MAQRLSKYSSILFVAIVFALLLIQLFVPDMTPAGLSENFLWRKDLIRLLNSARFYAGDRVFSQAIIGEDGWMYYTGEQSIADYQKTLRVNAKEIRASLEKLAALDQIVEGYGGTILFVVVPDKHTIYPQYMPSEIPVLREMSRFDRVLNNAANMGLDIEIVDLRKTLTDASAEYQVYQKTDTHWTCQGAFYSYQAIMNRLSVKYPDLTPHVLDDFNIKQKKPAVQDIPKMLGISVTERLWDFQPKFTPNRLSRTEQAVTDRQFVRIQIIENERKDLPTALIFHDSFYEVCQYQFLEQHFSRTYAIHYGIVESYSETILREQADVVIIQVAERFLPDLLDLINQSP